MGWLWLACFILTILLLGGAIAVFFIKRIGIMRFLYTVGGCSVAAYCVYLPLYVTRYDLLPALLGNLIKTLKVISLDDHAMESCEYVRQFLGQYGQTHDALCFAYEILIAIVHLLLPLIFAVTAVTLLMRCIARLHLGKLRQSRKVQHIFSEVNYKSTLLAKNIRQERPKDEIIFLEEDREKDHADLRESVRCTILNEQIENVHARAKKREVHYYCISTDEERNINSALAILSDLQHLKVRGGDEAERLQKLHQIQKRYKIYLFSTSAITEPMVDSLDKGMVELDVINEYQSVAYQLLDKHMLLDAADENKNISMVLCGFTNVTRELVRAASWVSQLPGYHLKIRIVGNVSADDQADFQATCPGLFAGEHDIAFLPCTNAAAREQLLKAHCADAGYIVVAEDTETKTIERAVELRRLYYRNDPSFRHAPMIFAHIENKDKADAVAGLQTAEENAERRARYNIIPFGGADLVYTYQTVTDSALEWLAKNVHLEYDYTYLSLEGKQDQQNVDAQLKKYNRFEVNKRSNRANALHIRYKLAALGLDYVPVGKDEDPQQTAAEDTRLLNEKLTDAVLQDMTVAEHDRWLVFHESEGWQSATIQQVERFKEAGLSGGTHKCPLLRMHPYICDFDELKKRAQQLKKEDSIIYDRSLIVNIPAIISGKRRAQPHSPFCFKIVERK